MSTKHRENISKAIEYWSNN